MILSGPVFKTNENFLIKSVMCVKCGSKPDNCGNFYRCEPFFKKYNDKLYYLSWREINELYSNWRAEGHGD